MLCVSFYLSCSIRQNSLRASTQTTGAKTHLAEQLDKLGMEVVEVDLRDAYAFGGGLHCCTADVYRDGECEDYFPVQ